MTENTPPLKKSNYPQQHYNNISYKEQLGGQRKLGSLKARSNKNNTNQLEIFLPTIHYRYWIMQGLAK